MRTVIVVQARMTSTRLPGNYAFSTKAVAVSTCFAYGTCKHCLAWTW